MKKDKLWEQVELLAVDYLNASEELREGIFAEIFAAMEKYLESCSHNSVNKAKASGITIPFDDFFSNYSHYLWDALKAYVETSGTYTIKNLVLKRFGFVERITWRNYSSKNEDGTTSYTKARWGSTDKMFEGEDGETMVLQLEELQVVSAEDSFIDSHESEEDEILNAFAAEYPRHANVIRFMSQGYEGKELAIVTGEAQTYDGKMRKLVQRSRELFGKFMQARNPRIVL